MAESMRSELSRFHPNLPIGLAVQAMSPDRESAYGLIGQVRAQQQQVGMMGVFKADMEVRARAYVLVCA